MLNVYLMRHAEAVPVGGPIALDYDRPLTPRGEAQARAVAKGLQKKGAAVVAVVSSPVLRAVQTARWVAKVLAINSIQTSVLLAPSGRAPSIAGLLERPTTAGLLLIGHQPDLSLLAFRLSGHEPGFSPACLSAFQWDSEHKEATYLWSLSPEEPISP